MWESSVRSTVRPRWPTDFTSFKSMKMETAIQAPFDAAIDQVLVKKGDIVEAHDLLIILKDRT